MAENEQAFISIKEAADYLNVEYKTVYRLVRLGQLPAGRIGGVYRIRRADLDHYFEQQKTTPPSAAPTPADLESGRSLPFFETAPPILHDEKQLLRCGRCLKLIASPAAAGGRCETDGCQKLICVDCWREADGHLCREHSPTAQEKLAEAHRLLADGTIQRLVMGAEARQREMGFINRFDYKISQIASIRNPISGRVVHVSDWGALRSAGDDTGRLLELRGVGYLDKTLRSQLPVNQRSLYDVHEAGESVGLMLEAVVLSHLEAYVRQGFDTAQATMADILPLLKLRADAAESRRAGYVLGIASPTGWDNDAVAYIQADPKGRSYSHRLLMPCLIDLETGALIYNTLDERLASLAPIFSPQLAGEAAEDLARRLRETLLSGKWGSISASQAAAEFGASEDLVAKAFARLGESGQFSVEQIKGVGLAISRRLG